MIAITFIKLCAVDVDLFSYILFFAVELGDVRQSVIAIGLSLPHR